MEYYFRYREVNEEEGSFYETDVEFPTLMKKHIQKHGTALQPIYEAISNSFEATKDENDSITIAMNFCRSLSVGLQCSDWRRRQKEQDLPQYYQEYV